MDAAIEQRQGEAAWTQLKRLFEEIPGLATAQPFSTYGRTFFAPLIPNITSVPLSAMAMACATLVVLALCYTMVEFHGVARLDGAPEAPRNP